jgi:hypothetical protein
VKRPDLEKLLGGYAAGTLTPEERRALFDAALADQSLFDALADEEALREVLADPGCRERVRSALVEPPGSISWWRRPTAWALAATAAAAVVLTVAVVRTKPAPPAASAPQQIAMAKKPAFPDSATSAPTIAPPAAAQARPASRAFAPPKSVTMNAPALAAPHKDLAAAQPAVVAAQPADPSGTLAARLSAPEPRAAGGVAAAPAMAAPPPPPPAADKKDAAALQSDAVAAARNEVAAASQHAARTRQFERVLAKPASAIKAKAEAAFGLHYTLLRGGEEVPPDTPFSRHESAGLRIEADRSGYLYVLAGKRILFEGSVQANQPVVVDTRPGLLHLILLPDPDSGPVSTLVSRTQQQFAGANQRVENLASQTRGDQSVFVQNSSPPPQAGVLTDVSINSR